MNAMTRLSAGIALAAALSCGAHDIPDDVKVRAFVKPEGTTLSLLVRVPLEAMREADIPLRGPGYIDLPRVGSTLDTAARLWFTDNALHGDDEVQENPLHTVSYLGMLHQALRDVSRWVEEGTAPPPSTDYEVADGQVVVPADAARRPEARDETVAGVVVGERDLR